MNHLIMPAIPNRLISKGEKSIEGSFVARQYKHNGFVHNISFDENLIEYDENYQNEVSHSIFFKRHLNEVYKLIKSKFPKGSKLVEVGCGKGAFLEIVKNDRYFDYEGFDNAYEGNDGKIQKRYLTTEDKIFADVIVLRHTLEHIKNPFDFIKFLKKIFDRKSFIFIEVPQFEWIIENKVLFDFSYEHVNYFTTNALCSLFHSIEFSGNFFSGQYQFCLAKLDNLSEQVLQENEDYKNWIDYDLTPFIEQFIKKLEYLEKYERFWVWGGATKGVLFLKHLLDIYPTLFERVVGIIDANPKKQGFFTPSTELKVISPNSFYKLCMDNDAIVVMNPNYLEEIIKDTHNNCEKKLNFAAY